MENISMQEIKQLIRSIAISGAANGLTVRALASDFKKMEGFDLPYARFGFPSVDSFLQSLTDTVMVNGNGPMAMVEPIVTQSNKHIRDFVQGGKNNSKRRPRQSLPTYRPRASYNNNGFEKNNRTSYSNKTYENQVQGPRKIYNREFDFCDTVNDVANSDSSDGAPVFTMSQDKKLEQIENTVERRKTSTDKRRCDDAIPDGEGLLLINALEVPKDAMSLGDAIEDAKLPDTVAPKQSLQIFVTEVHNPNRFWYHMGDSAEKIDELMNEIEAFYSHLGHDEWRVRPSNVVVGFYCVAKFLGLWHRAKIVSEYTHNRVKVFYIDYGTVAELELKDVKFMAKCFSSLPAQAMRASLAYIKPVNHRWTRDAAWSLLSLVYEKILYAYIIDVDSKQNSVDVVLLDTSSPQDVVINQQLFVKGHAIWEDNMHYKDKSTEDFRNRIKSYSELYPRFTDIENGIYPTLLEIGGYQSEGFDFDHHYTQSLRSNSEYMRNILSKTFTISPRFMVHQNTKNNPFSTISSETIKQKQYVQETDIQQYHMLEQMSFDCGDLGLFDTDAEQEKNPGNRMTKKQVRFVDSDVQPSEAKSEEDEIKGDVDDASSNAYSIQNDFHNSYVNSVRPVTIC
ncbi:tudor domain-containing protein 5 [Malaya genurostris]|uniref:tudor domain-containing protein 5 n=1 Tax=Malaya genurostris TaxID=325434 RepID=UPI0026F37ED7|nr:tudor domain-containing protein 5 [Malaya genurostris]